MQFSVLHRSAEAAASYRGLQRRFQVCPDLVTTTGGSTEDCMKGLRAVALATQHLTAKATESTLFSPPPKPKRASSKRPGQVLKHPHRGGPRGSAAGGDPEDEHQDEVVAGDEAEGGD